MPETKLPTSVVVEPAGLESVYDGFDGHPFPVGTQVTENEGSDAAGTLCAPGDQVTTTVSDSAPVLSTTLLMVGGAAFVAGTTNVGGGGGGGGGGEDGGGGGEGRGGEGDGRGGGDKDELFTAIVPLIATMEAMPSKDAEFRFSMPRRPCSTSLAELVL